MSVLPLKQADLDALYKIQCGSMIDTWSLTVLQGQLNSEQAINLGFYRDSELLGYILVRALFEQAELLQVAVSRNVRGQGIGKALIQGICQCLTRLQSEQLFLEVRESNHTAIALYHCCGFTQQGQRKGYYPATADNERENALIFTLALNKEKSGV